MKRHQDSRSTGQRLYELMASIDKTSHHWLEWRDLLGEDKEFYENAVLQFVQQWQEDQESSDSE